MRILAIDPGTEQSWECLKQRTETGILEYMEISKTCSKCLECLPLERFANATRGKYGKLSVCRVCHKAHYYTAKREMIMERTRARRLLPEVRDRERQWQRARRKENRLHRMLFEARHRAKRKGIEFSIKEESFAIPAVCPVLGIPITLDAATRADGSPSLERIDPRKGYIPGNVIIISWRANRIKSDATIEELETIVRFYRGRET